MRLSAEWIGSISEEKFINLFLSTRCQMPSAEFNFRHLHHLIPLDPFRKKRIQRDYCFSDAAVAMRERRAGEIVHPSRPSLVLWA